MVDCWAHKPNTEVRLLPPATNFRKMAQNCPSCNAACLSITPDTCVIWTGGDIDLLGIKNGDYYNDAIIAFVNKFLELSNGIIDVSGINIPGAKSAGDRLPLLEAVQRISDKLGNLSSSDITLSGDFSALSSDSLSNDAGQLINRFATYFIESADNGSLIGFDLQPALADLPQGYNVSKTNVVVYGSKKYGSNVIVDSTLPTFSAKVQNDRFPLSAEVTIRVTTPSGTVDLVKNISIDSSKVVQNTFKLDLKDRSKTTDGSMTLNQLVEIVSSQTRQNTSNLDQLRNLNIASSSNIKFPSTDAAAVISVLMNKVDSLITDVVNLQKVNYNNGGSTVSGTPSDILGVVSSTISDLTASINTINDNIDSVNNALGSPAQLKTLTIKSPCLSGNCK